MQLTANHKSPVFTLICTLKGHDYVVTSRITSHINEYQCRCCGKEVTDTDKGFLTELTFKQKEINKILNSYVQRRKKRITNKLTA